jgi:predicted deacetylase
MMPRALVVSLHDISPLTQAACRRIMVDLESIGAAPLSLLVIPDHHQRGRISSDAGLCAWLRDLAAQGHEIVTHGYFHRRPTKRHESLMQRLTTRVYTAGEGEFFDLPRDEAARRYIKGRAELREAGLEPRGFIAPAWLVSADAKNALHDEGCEYTTSLRHVTDLRTGRTFATQSMCWSVRTAWRRAASLAWNAWLFRRLKSAPLQRIAVHPVDIGHPAIWRQIQALIRAALRDRTAATYLSWIQSQRSRPATV